MDNQKIGQRIHDTRKEKNVTLQDIADALGVARSTIQRYEKGLIDSVKLPVLEAIARSLDVNPAWLIYKSTEKEPPRKPSPVFLSLREQTVIKAYRNNPAMQAAVDRLLGVDMEIAAELVPVEPSLEEQADNFAAMAREQFIKEKTAVQNPSSVGKSATA